MWSSAVQRGQRSTLLASCLRGSSKAPAIVCLRTTVKMMATVNGNIDAYTMDLDNALDGIMSKADYLARTAAPRSYSRPPLPVLPRNIADRANLALTQTDFERIMGTNDLVGVEYLAQGLRAAAAVARVLVLDPASGKRSYATGFMVSPRLFLTNRHVLPTIDVASASMIEFNYEYDSMGMTKDTEIFKLQPEEAFIVGDAHEMDADFALVAVAPVAERSSVSLSTFGYLRLDDVPGKIAEAEYITIIQHPGGSHKQIALRENEVIKKGANDKRPVLLYRSDTAPGSSGSPCFNDQWQVVALHSRGVPKTADASSDTVMLRGAGTIPRESLNARELRPSDVQWEANLGVRISYIVNCIQSMTDAASHPLLGDFLADVQRGGAPVVHGAAAHINGLPSARAPPGATHAAASSAPRRAGSMTRQVAEQEEATGFDGGYTPAFLGVRVGLPGIGPIARAFGQPLVVPGTRGSTELKYTHFSVIMNGQRRLAFVSAVNIDGAKKVALGRPKKFYADDRIGAEQQTDEYLYFEPGAQEDEFFDRGHLTRRNDVCWGPADEAQAANVDSFAFPNIAPQHKDFNQGKRLWGGLEDHILDNTVGKKAKASVFTGPIFSFDDLIYKGVPIPKEFYKVVVMNDTAARRQLRATAFVVSQADLVADSILNDLANQLGLDTPLQAFGELPQGRAEEEAVPAPLKRPAKVDMLEQLTIAALEQRTGLVFDEVVHNADVLASSGAAAEEAAGVGAVRVITKYADIVL